MCVDCLVDSTVFLSEQFPDLCHTEIFLFLSFLFSSQSTVAPTVSTALPDGPAPRPKPTRRSLSLRTRLHRAEARLTAVSAAFQTINTAAAEERARTAVGLELKNLKKEYEAYKVLACKEKNELQRRIATLTLEYDDLLTTYNTNQELLRIANSLLRARGIPIPTLFKQRV